MKPIAKSAYINSVWYSSSSEWFEARRCFIAIAFQLYFKYALRRAQDDQEDWNWM